MTSASAAELPTLDSGLLVEDSWVGVDVPADLRDELTGTTLNGTYRVERVLGEGGMGRVYEARHARIAQKRVAVKVLHPEFARDRDALVRFQREAEAAASISHPNVMAVLDVDRTPLGMPYLVCEYLEGIDLSEYLRRVGKLELGTVIHIAQQLCQALDAAHARGVIHRDLKPQNIFLVGDFSDGVPARPFVKVLDFGLSRLVNADTDLTQTGIIMGTPAFMPPEQALGHKADHRSDVYGVGAIVYKALTGQAPYEYDTAQTALMAVMKGEPLRLRAVDASIPVDVELVIERAMARDPARRYANMNALARALAQLEQSQSTGDGSKRGQGVVASAPGLSAEAQEAQSARPRLVLWLLASAIVLSAASAVAATSFEQMRRIRLSQLELGLTLALVLAFYLSLTVWLTRGLYGHVWKNTSRVVLVAGHVRAGLLAAIAVFGLGPLAVHLVDDFLVRFVGPLHLTPLEAAWPGWNLVLPLVALVAAVTVVLRRKVLLSAARKWQRVVGAGLLLGLGLALCGALIYGSLLWRANMKATSAARAGSSEGSPVVRSIQP